MAKTNELRAKKSRERSQRWRDAKKADANYSVKVKMDNHCRYEFNKSIGAVKTIWKLPSEEQEKLRQKWRISKAQQRINKNASKSSSNVKQPEILDIDEIQSDNQPSTSGCNNLLAEVIKIDNTDKAKAGRSGILCERNLNLLVKEKSQAETENELIENVPHRKRSIRTKENVRVFLDSGGKRSKKTRSQVGFQTISPSVTPPQEDIDGIRLDIEAASSSGCNVYPEVIIVNKIQMDKAKASKSGLLCEGNLNLLVREEPSEKDNVLLETVPHRETTPQKDIDDIQLYTEEGSTSGILNEVNLNLIVEEEPEIEKDKALVEEGPRRGKMKFKSGGKNQICNCQENSLLRKENASLRKQNATLKRQVERYKKRYQRNSSLTANQPEKEIENPVSDEQLVLEQQLIQNYKSVRSYKEKHALSRIFRGKVVKQYRKAMYFRKFAPKRYLSENSEANQEKKQLMIRDKIKHFDEFFELDCNSRMTSSVRDTITRNGVKKQRRYLLKTMEQLHSEYKQQSGSYKISYPSFCKMRPFWVLFPSCDKRDTCACKKHLNMALILEKLHTENVIQSASSKVLLAQMTCNISNEQCMLRTCMECKDNQVDSNLSNPNKLVTYYQWLTVTEDFIEKKRDNNGKEVETVKRVKKCLKKEIGCKLTEVLQSLKNDLSVYMKHVFFMEHQYKNLYEKRTNLPPRQRYFWVDWAENWSTKCAQEVQSMHFGGSRQQFSLHTCVAYTSKGERQSSCTLSECRQHGPPEIMAHLKPILTKMANEEEIDEIHFQSDSPVNQYRGKDMFALMVKVFPLICPGIKAFTWNYTESGHGKGPVDGVGCRPKALADAEVSRGKDIDTFDKFVECSKTLQNIFIDVVTMPQIEEMKKVSTVSNTFKGTQTVHQVTWSKDNPLSLYFNRLSCFQCRPGQKCSHFHLGELNYQEETATNEILPPTSTAAATSVSTKAWVVVNLSGEICPGVVQSIKGETVAVKMLIRSGEQGIYTWPVKKDVRRLHMDKIVLLKLEPISMSKNLYKVTFNES